MRAFFASGIGGIALAVALGACGGAGSVAGTDSSPRTTTRPLTTTEPAWPPLVRITRFHGSLRQAAATASGRSELSDLRLSGRCESRSGTPVTLSIGYPPPHRRFVQTLPEMRAAPARLRVHVACRNGRFSFHRGRTAVMQSGRGGLDPALVATARQDAAFGRTTMLPQVQAIE